jgi:hypothetical protein
MMFKPYDDFRELRSVGQAASALSKSNQYKIAEYRGITIGDFTSYPVTKSAEFFIGNNRVQSIIIDKRLVCVRATPSVRPLSFVTGKTDYLADIQAIKEWIMSNVVTMSVDGTPILNEVPMLSMRDGFFFDPTIMPIPKNTFSFIVDFSKIINSDWLLDNTPPLPNTVLTASIGIGVELWYTD